MSTCLCAEQIPPSPRNRGRCFSLVDEEIEEEIDLPGSGDRCPPSRGENIEKVFECGRFSLRDRSTKG